MCAIVTTLDGFLKFNLFLKAPLIKNDNYIEQDWIPPRNLFFSLFLSLEKSNMSMPRTASWYLEHSKGGEDGGKPHPHYQSPFRSTLLSRNKKIKKKNIKNSCLTPSLTSIYSLAHALLFRSSLAFTFRVLATTPTPSLTHTYLFLYINLLSFLFATYTVTLFS